MLPKITAEVNKGLIETKQSANGSETAYAHCLCSQVLHAVCVAGLGALIFGELLLAETVLDFGFEIAAARVAVVLQNGDAD